MNLVDSSGWLEYFADGPNAAFFAPAILDTELLVVPTLSLLEVFKAFPALAGMNRLMNNRRRNRTIRSLRPDYLCRLANSGSTGCGVGVAGYGASRRSGVSPWLQIAA